MAQLLYALRPSAHAMSARITRAIRTQHRHDARFERSITHGLQLVACTRIRKRHANTALRPRAPLFDRRSRKSFCSLRNVTHVRRCNHMHSECSLNRDKVMNLRRIARLRMGWNLTSGGTH
ncbi:hypothetical protein BRN32_10285 [Xanthomonas oryzae pv. oryzae]|nr:hypothetical protein BRN32_10285 [Xanthomonas oryzae pv. oryzae]UWU52983.1 hypothetical protein BRN95_10355 [Xanthomonas oryzae pv. oryzae]UWZ68920.1 hypothetical protein BHL62_10550 [Xanthomonas oryzae pv. oryzae]